MTSKPIPHPGLPRTGWRCLALWAGLCLLLFSGLSRADPQVAAQMAYIEDPAGALTVGQVAARQDFQPFTGPLRLGNRNVPTWIRISVPPAGTAAEPRVLLVEPASLNEVQFFTPTSSGWQMHLQGNRYAYSTQARDTLNASLLIDPPANAVTTYYLRVQSLTAYVLPQVVTQRENRMHDVRLDVGIGIYCGFALVFLLISLVAWISTRELLWGASALFDAMTLIYVTLYMGFVAEFILRDSTDVIPRLYLLSCTLHMLVGCLFYGSLVGVLDAPRWCRWGYLAGAAVAAGLSVMVLSGQTHVLPWVNQTILALSCWGLVVLRCFRSPDRLLRWSARILFGGLTLYFFYFTLPLVGLGEAGKLSLYPTLPSHFFSMAMTLLILGRRTWLNAQARQALAQAAREASRQFEQEQGRHAETAGFLGMLMHEIKNPLASIRVASELLSSGRVSGVDEQQQRYQSIQNAVDGINMVLQRCLDMDRLERGALKIEKTSEDIAALTRLWVTQHSQSARLRADISESESIMMDVPLYVLMLSNLVDNALKYSPPDSAVDLRWRHESGHMRLEVRNAVGRAGLPDAGKLFEKYYRSPMAQRNSGTGLGLYWVQRVCQMLGGEIAYRDEDGVVLFTLRLPT